MGALADSKLNTGQQQRLTASWGVLTGAESVYIEESDLSPFAQLSLDCVWNNMYLVLGLPVQRRQALEQVQRQVPSLARELERFTFRIGFGAPDSSPPVPRGGGYGEDQHELFPAG